MSLIWRLLRLIAIALAFAPVSASCQEIAASDLALRPGLVIESTITKQQLDAYHFELKSGEFIRMDVDQKGVDLTSSFFDASGRKLHTADYRWAGVESASLVAPADGRYRLELRTVHPHDGSRPYSIRVVVRRAGAAGDAGRVSAEAISTEIKALIRINTAEAKQKALSKCAEVLTLWQSQGDRTAEAQTVNSTGYLHNEFNRQDEAVASLTRGLALWREAGDPSGEGEALHNLAAASSVRGDKRKAIELYQAAVELRRSAGDLEGAASTLANMGANHFVIGEPEPAITAMEESLRLWAQSGNRQGQVQSMINLGAAKATIGENGRALDAFESALPLSQEIGDTRGEAYVLFNLGRLREELGDKASAVDYLERTIRLMEKIGDTRGLAGALLSAGSVYLAEDQLTKALAHYQRSLENTKDPFIQAPAMLGIARVHGAMRNRTLWLEMTREALQRAVAVEDRRTEAAARRGLAEISLADNQPQTALEHLDAALAIYQRIRFQLGEATTRLAIARARSKSGHLDAALQDSEAALKLIESIRTRVSSSNLRSSYFASKQDFFRFHIDLLMQLHAANPSARYDLAALNTSERARGRGLLDLLHEAGIDVQKGANPALVAEKRSIQQQLNLLASTLMRLPQGKQVEASRLDNQKKIDALLSQLDAAEARLRASSPEYAALMEPRPATVRDIQRFLRPGTALIEYAFGEQRAYAWVIKAQTVRSFELASESDIVAATNGVREWSSGKSTQRLPAAELAALLIRPIAAEIEHQDRLVIVPESALLYVPFGALPLPSGVRLGHSREMTLLPSASILAALDRNASARKTRRSQVVVFADPVFHRDDERLTRIASKGAAHAYRAVEESSRQIQLTDSGARLPRLRFSREEAKAIAETAPKRVTTRLDFAANRVAATGALTRNASIVHFATHTFINSFRPELSGIVLSLIDQQGAPQDGFLRLHDIYNLDIPADLVVLSSCESALGKEVSGEGLIGFTRAFHYAGSSRVLATLWKVNDEPTAEFMRHFYDALLTRKVSAAAALRDAQKAMASSNDPRWSAPHAWAGFVLYGDWR